MEPKDNPKSESRAARIVAGLLKVGLAVKSRKAGKAGLHGLTPAQAQILAFLEFGPQESSTLSEIAEGMAITPPTASVSVSSLVGKGLVTRRRSAADGRAVTLTLSAAGGRMAHEVSDWTDFLVSAVEALDPGEQEVFVKGLVKIIRTLQVRGEIPLSRMCVTCRYFRPNAHPGRPAPHHCGYVDMAFGHGDLRFECPEHEAARDEMQMAAWPKFLGMNGGEQTAQNNHQPDTGANR
jgi:DNA-binding MarR family transcriptional regulator